MTKKAQKAEPHTRYPTSSIFIYNGATILHFLFGGIGILLGYSFSWWGTLFGVLYVVFAFSEMYVLMPLKVCPNCVYYLLEDSVCVSGMNVVSKKVAKQGNLEDFPNLASGLLCPNNLYMAALGVPILAMSPALFFNYSLNLLVVFLFVVALMLFRFFVIFPKIACVHCRAKQKCPQAGQMGVREL